MEEREERRERWWVNWIVAVGAVIARDWWVTVIALALKLVSVKLAGLGRAFPTFSLGFWKSFCLEAFFFVEEPIAGESHDGRSPRSWAGVGVRAGKIL